jgi:hypothetical protein
MMKSAASVIKRIDKIPREIPGNSKSNKTTGIAIKQLIDVLFGLEIRNFRYHSITFINCINLTNSEYHGILLFT